MQQPLHSKVLGVEVLSVEVLTQWGDAQRGVWGVQQCEVHVMWGIVRFGILSK